MWKFRRNRPIHFRNAQVVDTSGVFASDLHLSGSRIAGFHGTQNKNEVQVDLNGAYIFPGLINAHDHLEHNHYGRVKFREKYWNAIEWKDDVNPRLQTDPRLVSGKSKPLADRLFIGGIKNLLSGATTVAHHNPFYRQLNTSFPVSVLRNYGWAHSLYLQGGKAGANAEPAGQVLERYHSTPGNFPFILHLAEGVDESARSELRRLDQMGALGLNTVLVHGVGIDLDGWSHLTKKGAGLIWCPASNIYLLGQTIPVRKFLDTSASENLILGTDSRLTGSGDLLDEMRFAREVGEVTAQELFFMVTKNAARLLRLSSAGRMSIGLPADLVVAAPVDNDPFESLLRNVRSSLMLVVVSGQPLYGSIEMSEVFGASAVETAYIQVDGELKLMKTGLARRLQKCSISEGGVQFPADRP